MSNNLLPMGPHRVHDSLGRACVALLAEIFQVFHGTAEHLAEVINEVAGVFEGSGQKICKALLENVKS